MLSKMEMVRDLAAGVDFSLPRAVNKATVGLLQRLVECGDSQTAIMIAIGVLGLATVGVKVAVWVAEWRAVQGMKKVASGVSRRLDDLEAKGQEGEGCVVPPGGGPEVVIAADVAPTAPPEVVVVMKEEPRDKSVYLALE
jgi:hypothetical protein